METIVQAALRRGCGPLHQLPETVLQFGEGNFLRGFVDWMFHRMIEAGLYKGRVVVVQPLERGLITELNVQQGLYTLLLRGLEDGKTVESTELIRSVSRGINPYRNYDAYLQCADNAELRVIVSNTTEAGIALDPEDGLHNMPPASYPGKLTALLYRRYLTFGGDPDKGFIILPCELIDRNGDTLKRVVQELARSWRLEAEFIAWVENANRFANTLVDRIVTGYPQEEADSLLGSLGYADKLLNAAEPFHLWVIEGDEQIRAELPFAEAGLNVVWTDDLERYRTRKVAILNGAHTMTAPAAFLTGIDTVLSCTEDELVTAYMRKGLFEEIIPSLDWPQADMREYAEQVLERFANKYIRHELQQIALNSISKFRTRLLPSLLAYERKHGAIPPVLCFSLAALIAYCRGEAAEGGQWVGSRQGQPYPVRDVGHCIDFFRELWSEPSSHGPAVCVPAFLAYAPFWDTDLTRVPRLADTVVRQLQAVDTYGMREAMNKIVRGELH